MQLSDAPYFWLGESDPVQSQATIRDGDDSRIALATLLEAWHSHLGSTAYQVRDIVQMAIAADGDFKHVVLEVCLDRQGQPSTKILGYYLRRMSGVVVNGYRLVRGQRLNSGIPWKVEKVQPLKKTNEPETSTPSTLSTLKNVETVEGKGIQNSVDKNSIYIDKTEPNAQGQSIGVDAKSSIPHLHHTENLSQREIQEIKSHDGVDGVDTSGRYKVKTEVIVDADDF